MTLMKYPEWAWHMIQGGRRGPRTLRRRLYLAYPYGWTLSISFIAGNTSYTINHANDHLSSAVGQCTEDREGQDARWHDQGQGSTAGWLVEMAETS